MLLQKRMLQQIFRIHIGVLKAKDNPHLKARIGIKQRHIILSSNIFKIEGSKIKTLKRKVKFPQLLTPMEKKHPIDKTS